MLFVLNVILLKGKASTYDTGGDAFPYVSYIVTSIRLKPSSAFKIYKFIYKINTEPMKTKQIRPINRTFKNSGQLWRKFAEESPSLISTSEKLIHLSGPVAE